MLHISPSAIGFRAIVGIQRRLFTCRVAEVGVIYQSKKRATQTPQPVRARLLTSSASHHASSAGSETWLTRLSGAGSGSIPSAAIVCKRAHDYAADTGRARRGLSAPAVSAKCGDSKTFSRRARGRGRRSPSLRRCVGDGTDLATARGPAAIRSGRRHRRYRRGLWRQPRSRS